MLVQVYARTSHACDSFDFDPKHHNDDDDTAMQLHPGRRDLCLKLRIIGGRTKGKDEGWLLGNQEGKSLVCKPTA